MSDSTVVIFTFSMKCSRVWLRTYTPRRSLTLTSGEWLRPPQYQPMKKQGAIILGIGGDSSDWAIGTFYEGVMAQGYASDETTKAVHANIVAAGYGK